MQVTEAPLHIVDLGLHAFDSLHLSGDLNEWSKMRSQLVAKHGAAPLFHSSEKVENQEGQSTSKTAELGALRYLILLVGASYT